MCSATPGCAEQEDDEIDPEERELIVARQPVVLGLEASSTPKPEEYSNESIGENDHETMVQEPL